jgi:protein gp138
MTDRVDSLAELIRLALDARALDTHTALPCKVLAYHPATQRAQLQPLVTRAVPSSDNPVLAFLYEVLPVLHEVPVAFPRGGGTSITWPITTGDTLLVIFAEADIAGWVSTGQLSNPDDVRRHGLHGGIAIPGLGADLEPLLSAVDPGIVLTADTIKLGAVSAAQFVALATLVEQLVFQLANAIVTSVVGAADGGALWQTNIKAALTTAGWVGASGTPPAGSTASTKVSTDG